MILTFWYQVDPEIFVSCSFLPPYFGAPGQIWPACFNCPYINTKTIDRHQIVFNSLLTCKQCLRLLVTWITAVNRHRHWKLYSKINIYCNILLYFWFNSNPVFISLKKKVKSLSDRKTSDRAPTHCVQSKIRAMHKQAIYRGSVRRYHTFCIESVVHVGGWTH